MNQYTTVKLVRQKLTRRFKKDGKRTSFINVLKEIVDENLFDDSPVFREERSLYLLSLDALRRVVDSIPIYINPIVQNKSSRNIAEDIVIPSGRDVLGFVNLPFVDDGLHFHDHFELNFVYSGRAVQQLDSEKRILEQWDLCIVAPDFPHKLDVNDEESLVLTYLIRRSSFDNIFKNLLLQDDLLARFFRNTLYKPGHSKYLLFRIGKESPVLQKILQDILIESNSQKPYSSAFANCLLQELFYTLLRNHGGKINYFGLEKLSHSQNFSAILLYLENNYRTATLSAVSSFFQYSEGYLSRLFKRNLDMNFTAVMQAIRLRKAKSLLLGTDMSVSAISEQVGYESADSFAKCFKRHFHCTPSDFRSAQKMS